MSKLASPIKIVYWIDGVGGIWLEIRRFSGQWLLIRLTPFVPCTVLWLWNGLATVIA
jgi:hypothetical protein